MEIIVNLEKTHYLSISVYLFFDKERKGPIKSQASCFSIMESICLIIFTNYIFFLLSYRFENELIVAVGKGEPAAVMSEYGFK